MSRIIFMPLLIIYFEIILKLATYDNVFNEGLFFMFIFSIPIGLLLYLLTSSFKENTNKIIFFTITTFLTIFYAGQVLYYKIFSTFASLYFFIGAKKAAQFYKVLFEAATSLIVPLIFLAFPLIFLAIYNKRVHIAKTVKQLAIRISIAAIALQLIAVILVLSSDKGVLSASYLYKDVFLVNDAIDKFGLLTAARLDIKNIIINSKAFASEEKVEIVETENEETQKETAQERENEIIKAQEKKPLEYNSLDINFAKLIEEESVASIKSMHEYFNTKKPTAKNDYTGMFKNKNLIMVTAEGFSPYAINKELTPTLYKMYEEGFKFTDFYTPLWGVSTSDGEYVACTGLLPKEGIWSFYKSSKNYMPFCLGNQLKNLNYSTFAYHNHYYDYYFRHKSHPNMGYTYKGLGNGLNVAETWPESDVEMIELTVDEFIDKQPFHVYYMTVSGHLEYNFGGNYIALKNKSLVEDLNYSNNVKAYLSCNIELDRAIEKLVQKLKEANIAEDTLIAISPDHYPYGLTIEEISELAGHKVDKEFELYKGVFLLWSENIKKVEINKTASSLDILPTLLNLMGLDYDSRLLIGNDIFSDSEPLVILQNRSFITDKVFYNSKTGDIVLKNNSSVDEAYINRISEKVKQKFKVSAMILDNDYYSKVLNNKK